MSDTHPARTGNRSELGVAALLVVLGGLVLWDASRIPARSTPTDPIGPGAVPVLVGVVLLACAVVLAVDVLRGGRGEAEAGEDVDPDAPSDWRTILLLVAAFLANVVLIERAGWPVSGAVLFWGCAYALGSRRYVRDVLIAVVLSVLTYLLFARGLGVQLPAGVLEGVL